jgi:hypothetical protein
MTRNIVRVNDLIQSKHIPTKTKDLLNQKLNDYKLI